MKQKIKKYDDTSTKTNLGSQLCETNIHNRIIKWFQQNVISYHHSKSKSAHAVYVYENQYENCKKIGVASANLLGFQVSEKITDSNGISISYFELGAIVSGIGIPEPIICRYMFPKIGNPGIVNPDKSHEIRNFIRGTFDPIKKSVYDHIIERNPYFFEEIFSNNFFLRPVPSKSSIDDVLLFPEINVEPISPTGTNEREVIVSFSFGSSPSVSLHDKTLFDLVFKFVNEFVLAPHGIFANKNWDNFVILHVTDIHVSRRIEYAKDDLKKFPDAINEFNIRYFNNFNDNLRDFISFANSLHKSGSLVCILATGDLVDYIFDSGEETAMTPRDPSQVDRSNGNNFDFFKRLILGLEPGRDGTKNEELLVPIFTSLGNHDYRDLPYCWRGRADTPGPGTEPLNNYESTNLLFTEALGLEDGGEPEFGPLNAAKMVHIDTSLPRYDEINSNKSYQVNLGPHRIVMLDSGADLAAPQFDSVSEFTASVVRLLVKMLGRDSDNSKRFFGGSPNSRGITKQQIDLVRQAISEAGPSGTVIVGIHAPLVDISYYPHYLRETDRIGNPDENLNKRGFPYFAPFFSFSEGYDGNGKQPGWQLTGTPFFKSGDIDFTLSNGVSRGLNQEFLEICAGVGVSRKVDLVLSGHGHHNFEFRFVFDQGNHFFHDYYTENPTIYYATKMLSESDFNSFMKERQFESFENQGTAYTKFLDKTEFFFTVPKDGLSGPRFAQTSIPASHAGDSSTIADCIEVPSYPTPLNKTNDKNSWWSRHRPLFIQTAPIGPIETKNNGARNADARLSDYSFFHGCRKITIKNNVISSIEVVHMSEIRGSRPRLCSLKELCRVRGVALPVSLRSLAEDIKRIPPISERLKKE